MTDLNAFLRDARVRQSADGGIEIIHEGYVWRPYKLSADNKLVPATTQDAINAATHGSEENIRGY